MMFWMHSTFTKAHFSLLARLTLRVTGANYPGRFTNWASSSKNECQESRVGHGMWGLSRCADVAQVRHWSSSVLVLERSPAVLNPLGKTLDEGTKMRKCTSNEQRLSNKTISMRLLFLTSARLRIWGEHSNGDHGTWGHACSHSRWKKNWS